MRCFVILVLFLLCLQGVVSFCLKNSCVSKADGDRGLGLRISAHSCASFPVLSSIHTWAVSSMYLVISLCYNIWSCWVSILHHSMVDLLPPFFFLNKKLIWSTQRCIRMTEETTRSKQADCKHTPIHCIKNMLVVHMKDGSTTYLQEIFY